MSPLDLEAARSILILLAAGVFLAVVTYDLHAMSRGGWRLAFLQAFVLSGILVSAFSEVLGAFKVLATTGLLICWVVAATAAVIAAIRRSPRNPEESIVSEFSRLQGSIGALPASAKWTLCYLAIVGIVLATIAFWGAPNTWDSMTYHLSRVMHWQQNRSMAFYPTAIQRQLAFGPWAEMAVLQFQVLTGSDRLANFVQLFAALGCAAGVSLLVKQLGGNFWGQLFAALAFATIPMAILQATSTQNDLVTALWCTAFVALLLQERTGYDGVARALLIGAAGGLAVLTKVTALIFLAPFSIWYAVQSVRRERWNAWRSPIMSLGVAIVVVSPHALRNIGLFGNPLGVAPGPELSGYNNEVLGIPTLLSNVLRNSSLQLAVPSQRINAAAQSLVESSHGPLGIGASDPRTTWDGARYGVIFSMYEDSAGNPLHFLLLVFGAAVVFRPRTSALVVFEICALSAFALFCLLLRWQPWNTRLMLPLLVLAVPPTAILLSRLLPGSRVLFPGIALALLAVPYILSNPTRPMLGDGSIYKMNRQQQYFMNVPDDPGVYAEAARLLSDSACDRIGLASPPEGREYLLWVINNANDHPVRIEHILVKNPSRRYGVNFVPCAIAITYPYPDQVISFAGSTFEKHLATERFSLFLLAGAIP